MECYEKEYPFSSQLGDMGSIPPHLWSVKFLFSVKTFGGMRRGFSSPLLVRYVRTPPANPRSLQSVLTDPIIDKCELIKLWLRESVQMNKLNMSETGKVLLPFLLHTTVYV